MAAAEAVGVVVIVVLAVVTVVMFVVSVAATILVAGAVRAEQRQRKPAFHADSRTTRLARWLLFVSDLSPARSAADPDPEERPAWYERAGGPSRR
jgi:hypothetical protein